MLYAWNDLAAIILELDTKLEGGLQGDTLLGIIGACSDKTIAINVDIEEGIAVIEFGTGVVKLPLMPPEDFVFEVPDENPILKVTMDEAAIKGLELCLLCVSDNALRANLNGVTVMTNTLVSSNGTTLAQYSGLKVKGKHTAIIPKFTCEQIVSLCKTFPEEKAVLEIGESFLQMTIANVALVSKLISEKPVDFASITKKVLAEASFYEIPEGILGELTKANILQSAELEKKLTMTQKGLELRISTRSNLGGMNSVLKLTQKQPERQVGFHPEHMLRALSYVSQMAITESHITALQSEDESFLYIISSNAV